jgi:hypothetical protein
VCPVVLSLYAAISVLRVAYLSSEWDRLKEDVPVMEAELKKLRNDLELGRMQAVLERLQGHREIPMSDIVNTNLQEILMEDITNTDE